MQRAVKAIQPFEFRSDFDFVPAEPAIEDAVPASEDEAKISLTGAELAQLLFEARAEGIADAEARDKREDNERLQAVTDHLNQALANLVALAGHLEAAAYEEKFNATSIMLINEAAQRIVDGQGDLFAERKDLEVMLGIPKIETIKGSAE